MIPILYKQSETAFADNGIGRLAGCRSCTVTEQRNGSYELTLTYPASGPRAFDLTTGRIVYATHDYTGTPEPFRIYSISKATGGLITVRARHIAYDLASVIVRPSGEDIVIGLDTAQEFIDHFLPHIIGTNRFSFVSDVLHHYYASKTWLLTPQVPISMWELLGGSSGDTLQGQFAGEFKYEKWKVKYLVQRGQDRGVKFRRGRSYSSLDVESNVADLVIGVIPYWVGTDLDTGDDITVMNRTASDPVIYYGDASAHPGGKIIPLDCSSIFDEVPTVADIEAAADEYIERDSMNGRDAAIYKVNLVKDTADSRWNELQGVALCDLVWIEDEVLGIGTGDVRVAEEVTELTYDTLAERTTSVTLGVDDKRITEALKFPSTRERVGKIIIEDMTAARTGQHTAGTTATAKTNSAKVKALEKKIKEPATSALRGTVKPGRGLSVDADGTLNADGGADGGFEYFGEIYTGLSTAPDPYYMWKRNNRVYFTSGTSHKVWKSNTGRWGDVGFQFPSTDRRLDGFDVWTDGSRVFYSQGNTQYELTGSGVAGTWVVKSWGAVEPVGHLIWHDADGNTYFTDTTNNTTYKLNSSDIWEAVTFTGMSGILFEPFAVWNDGTNTYYDDAPAGGTAYHFKLNGTAWTKNTWSGYRDINGSDVWEANGHIFYSNGSSVQYELKEGVWKTKAWFGLNTINSASCLTIDSFEGSDVWTDGDGNIYRNNTDTNKQYKLIKYDTTL